MFCPSCGAEYTIELKYCNRCGANLSAGVEPYVPPVVMNITKPALIISLLVLTITLGGFGALVKGTLLLAPFLQGNDPLMLVIVLGMLTILAVDIFLVRLLSKLVHATLLPSAAKPVPPRNIPAANPAQYLRPQTTSGLQQVPSVTENTTRFFEPQSVRRETNEPAQDQKPES